MKYQIIPFGKNENRIQFVHLKRPGRNGMAGMVISKLFKDKHIAIIVDDESTAYDYEFACLSLTTDKSVSAIKMYKSIFYGIKQGNPIARMVLFHELGHYYYGDLQGEKFDQEAYQSSREEAVKNGNVIEEELRADAFAVKYFGREYVMRALQMLRDRIQEKYAMDKAVEPVIEEINIRIQNLI